MRVDELKNKILQLAIQGKLVKQNPSDTPASLLLEQIKSEKEQLIKEKKIKKEKPLPEITEEERAFELPKGWEWCRLGEVFNIKSSKRIFEKDYVETGIPFFRSKEIGLLSGNNNISKTYYISNEKYNELKTTVGVPKLGDLLVTSVGTIGKSWIVDNREFYYKDGNITQLENNKYIFMKYVQTFIRSLYFFEQVGKTVTGTAYNALTITKFKNIIFPLPPLEEQQRIVSKVDELFKIIDELNTNKDEILNNISNTRNKVLQLAIQGKLVEQCETDKPAKELIKEIKLEKERLIKEKIIKKEKPLPEIVEDEKAFELPNGWEWCRLGEIGYFQKGYAFKSNEYLSMGIKITKVSNLNNPKSKDIVYVDKSREQVYEQYKLYNNDIVLTTVGSWPTAPASVVGNVIYIDDNFHNTLLNQNAVRIRSNLSQKYLNIVLKSIAFKSYILDIAQGTANQASITQNDIKNFVIPVPPLEEQQRIVSKVDTIMAYLDELEKTIKADDNTN